MYVVEVKKCDDLRRNFNNIDVIDEVYTDDISEECSNVIVSLIK